MSTVMMGDFNSAEVRLIREAVEPLSESPVFTGHLEGTERWLDNNPAPRCVFVRGDLDDLPALVHWVRSQARLFTVPVVAMIDELDPATFSLTHLSGADDIQLRTDYQSLRRRCDCLAEFDPDARAQVSQGRCVLQHPDPARRLLLGRVLRQAGFDMSFAAREEELVQVATRGPSPSLLVLYHRDDPAAVVNGIVQAREKTSYPHLPAILLCDEDKVREMAVASTALAPCAVGAAGAPLDNLLFLANDVLTLTKDRGARESARALYGSMCAFRPAGDFQARYGLTYNISAEGLYVRTLDSLPSGTNLWLELLPPYQDEAVHLRGKVVWSRGLHIGAGGASPPGFGVRFDSHATPPDDWDTYLAGYRELELAPMSIRCSLEP